MKYLILMCLLVGCSSKIVEELSEELLEEGIEAVIGKDVEVDLTFPISAEKRA